jgi:flagellar basal body rod protein FlgB
MNLLSLNIDNVTEMLVKVIAFTQSRQKIITQNINNLRGSDFVPMDLAVYEFCGVLNQAIGEHARTRRLVLCDTENVKFGECGSFDFRPMIDTQAKELLQECPDKYLEQQMAKLMENALNQRIAAELLKHRQTEIAASM